MGSDGSLQPWRFRGCCNLVLSLKERQSWFWGAGKAAGLGAGPGVPLGWVISF